MLFVVWYRCAIISRKTTPLAGCQPM